MELKVLITTRNSKKTEDFLLSLGVDIRKKFVANIYMVQYEGVVTASAFSKLKRSYPDFLVRQIG